QAGEQATRPNRDLGATTTTTSPGNTGSTTPNSNISDPLDNIPINGLDGGGGGSATSGGADPGLPFWLKAILFLVVGTGLGALWLVSIPRLIRHRWQRRRARAQSVGERVLLSWHEAVNDLDRAGVGAFPSETPFEYAHRVQKDHRVDAAALSRLAELTTTGAYAPGDPPEADAKEAEALRHEIERHMWSRSSWQRHVRWMADPRPLITRLPEVTSHEPAVMPEQELIVR
ncbi:MAG TPA: DUF4129 domain-containing protein, partial [Acidimicrobiales bacterium]